MLIQYFFRAFNCIGFANNTPILQLFKISMRLKRFSHSYIICTSQNNDTDDKSRKRKFNKLKEELNEFFKFKLNKFKEEELKSTTDIKNNKIKYLSSSSSLFQEPEVYSENSSESYHQLEALDLSVSSSFFQEPEVYSENSSESYQSEALDLSLSSSFFQEPKVYSGNFSESNHQLEALELSISSCLSPELKVNSENSSESNQPEIIEISDSSCMSPELEVQSQISLKNYQPKLISIDYNNTKKNINYYEAILKYLERKKIESKIIKSYFLEMIRNYESNKTLINEGEFIAKIEEILKKNIERSFLIKYYTHEPYSAVFEEIYEISSKNLNIEIKYDKTRSLYKLLLDINFEDDISKNKKDVVIKFKDILTKTKDYKEMEINIKKIFEGNYEKYFAKTYFINFLHNFFVEEEYFLLKLLKGSYKNGKNPHIIFLKDDILNIIIESYSGDKLSLVFNNVNFHCRNIILKRFCEEDKKKFEIFTIYINYMVYKQQIYYIEYINEMQYKPYMNYFDDMKYMKSNNYSNYYDNIISNEIRLYFLNSYNEMISAYIYNVNFNIRCFPNWSKKFITRISNLRRNYTEFNVKFLEYRNYFDKKEGILKYLNEDQYSKLKEFLYEL